jgi:hypothetical protein
MAVRTLDIPDIEFRRHRRFLCLCTVSVTGQSATSATVADLSESGARLLCSQPLGIGTRLRLAFEGYAQAVSGAVRFERQASADTVPAQWQIGVEFSGLQPALLTAVVAKRQR